MVRAITIVLSIGIFCAFDCSGILEFGDPPDMTRYFESIRKLRMSETSWTTLHTLADVRAGFMVLVCEEGRPYQVTYSNASCPAPNANRDSLQADFKRKSDVAKSEFTTLQTLADTDSSGFISTEESSSLKRLIEFGRQFPAVLAVEHADTNLILFSMNMNRPDLERTIDDYRRLSGELVLLGRQPLSDIEW